MNKRMREILAALKAKREEAKGFTAGENKDLEKAASLLDEAEELQKEYDIEKRLFEASKDEVPEDAIEVAAEAKGIKAFAAAARNLFKGMNEGTPEDGGYTVPEDISTLIVKYRSAKRSLLDLVHIIPVKTETGARTFKKRSQQTGFVKVGEGGKIPATAAPKYERKTYTVEKYAGYMPVTNELLADSDAAIANEVAEWMGDESRVTGNKLILAALDGIGTLTEITGIDDIKKAFNVTLGQAFKGTSSFITNDDGLQWLDTLKNSDGDYLLQPNPQDPMQLRICAGATIIPVEVIPNEDMPSSADAIPVYMGDLKEAIKYFDRQKFQLKASDIASTSDVNAFEEDLTLFRGIEREDVQVFDDQAVVRAKIAIPQG